MKAVYIHGFAGSIHSETFGNLSKYYPKLDWVALEVDHHGPESVAKINTYLLEHPDVELLMGSSLGGFYVLCADFPGQKLVINPTLHPMSTLKPRVGVNKYRGRRENGETEFKLTMQDLFAFQRCKPKDTPNTLCHYTEHDQVMGEEARREYPKFFKQQEMTKDLKNHFMDEHYIHTRLGELLRQWGMVCLTLLLSLLPLFSAAAKQPCSDTLRVLCIGNSFTYFYNSYDLLDSIAASEGHYLQIQTACVGGYTFHRHLHDLNTLQAIERALYVGPFEAVFLQDQSQAAAHYANNPKQYHLILEDTRMLVRRIRIYSPMADIRLEQTWAFPEGECGGFGTMERFDRLLKKGCRKLANSSKVGISPIGEAFSIVRTERPDIDLYEPDRKHPSLAGAYLKSCVNFLMLYPHPFHRLETDDCGMDKNNALYLRSVAERVCLK